MDFLEPVLSEVDEVASHLENDLTKGSINNNTFNEGEDYTHQQYRTLSLVSLNKVKQRQSISLTANAFELLLTKNVAFSLGTNKDGVYYVVVYGSNYCKAKDKEEKELIHIAF